MFLSYDEKKDRMKPNEHYSEDYSEDEEQQKLKNDILLVKRRNYQRFESSGMSRMRI